MLAEGSSKTELSLQELLSGLLPALKGRVKQRGAFMFACYDADGTGGLSVREMSDMLAQAPVGTALERDLVEFARFTMAKHGTGAAGVGPGLKGAKTNVPAPFEL